VKFKVICILLSALFFISTEAFSEPTHITVRVKTKDAKFLGTSMGGALVTITNAQTNKQLAKGVTEGATGNTNLIMIKPHERGVPISDERSAKYIATIDIDEPTQILVTAQGPLSESHAINSVQATQWVMPGKHVNRGDAMMLELPGLMVKLMSPSQDTSFYSSKSVEIQAVVRMM
jgi:hypothetical protein